MPVAAPARRINRVRYRSFDLVGALPDVRGTIVETGAMAGRLLASLEVPSSNRPGFCGGHCERVKRPAASGLTDTTIAYRDRRRYFIHLFVA